MNGSDPLPRLLRLHGAISRAAPQDNESVSGTDVDGLTEIYTALRESVRRLATDIGIAEAEFDAEVPTLTPATSGRIIGPESLIADSRHAGRAAARLRSLRGYTEGLLTMTLVTEDLTPAQVELIQRVVTG